MDYLYSTWLKDTFGEDTPHQSIENAVINLINSTSQSELPIKLSRIATLIGINPMPLYRDQSSLGELIEVNNELRISLKSKSQKPVTNQSNDYSRLRFAYAHELIHCLHYDLTQKPPIRIAPRSAGKKEEEICNYGASLLILPKRIVNQYIESIKLNDIIILAESISRSAHSSLQAAFIFLFKNENFLIKENRIYILSANSHEGFRERKAKKHRCIISIVYFENGNKDEFVLPFGKSIDIFGDTWSLISFHNQIGKIDVFYVTNEMIKIKNEKYIVNGSHKRVLKSGYVFSDLKISRL